MSKLLFAMVATTTFLSAGIAHSQPIPAETLTPYSRYRLELIKNGWKPIAARGVLGRNGKPMYLFPELSCGNRMCTADWVSKNGRKISISVWMKKDGGYVVAPQWD